MLAGVGSRYLGEAQAARAASLFPEGSFSQLAELARMIFQVDAVVIDLAGHVGLWSGGTVEAPPGRSVAVCDTLPAAAREGLIELVDPLAARAAGYGFHVTTPVRIDEEEMGRVVLIARTSRDIAARELEMLRRIAALVGEGLVLRLGRLAAA